MRGLMLVAVLAAGCGVRPSGGGRTVDRGVPLKDQVLELMDDTPKAKGKTFTLRLLLASDTGELRSRSGQRVELFGDVESVPVRLHVTIPDGLEVPNVRGLDAVRVSFTCTEGALSRGNVATKVVRAE